MPANIVPAELNSQAQYYYTRKEHKKMTITKNVFKALLKTYKLDTRKDIKEDILSSLLFHTKRTATEESILTYAFAYELSGWTYKERASFNTFNIALLSVDKQQLTFKTRFLSLLLDYFINEKELKRNSHNNEVYTLFLTFKAHYETALKKEKAITELRAKARAKSKANNGSQKQYVLNIINERNISGASKTIFDDAHFNYFWKYFPGEKIKKAKCKMLFNNDCQINNDFSAFKTFLLNNKEKLSKVDTYAYLTSKSRFPYISDVENQQELNKILSARWIFEEGIK